MSTKPAAAHMREISNKKKVLLSVLLILITLSVLETAVRLGADFVYNRSPYFLFYGLKSALADDDPEGHSASFKGYFKFPPNKVLHQYGMFQKPTLIQINSLGFRGKDFNENKSSGVFRIICMGGSSTFGFYDRDGFTYPAILERKLNDRSPDRAFEVINAGIPHMNSDNLVALFQNELIRYKPNVITIYAGYNDAVHLVDATLLEKVFRWLHKHSAIYVAMKRLSSIIGGPTFHSKYSTYMNRSNTEHVNSQVKLHVEKYQRNLEQIVALAESNNAKVVLIKQPVRVLKSSTASPDTWSYESDVKYAHDRLTSGKFLSGDEALIIVHSKLLESLERIASERDIKIIDNVKVVNDHPEFLASYVHLTEEGNEALAKELASSIFEIYSQSQAYRVN